MVTFLILLAMTGLFLLVGKIMAGKKGMIIAFVLALVMNGVSYWFSDSIVLAIYQAKPVDQDHRLYKIVADISQRAKLPMPRVYIVESASPNAFATGRNPSNAAVAATSGILNLLNDNELTGVIGHEIGHVANRDILTSSIAASLAGGVMLLARFAMMFGGNEESSWGKSLAASIIAPIAASLLQMALSRDREYEADEFGAEITQRPIWLADALLKLKSGVKSKPLPDDRPETAHLFIVHPFSANSWNQWFSTHPPIEKRVAKLRQMKVSAK